MSVCAKVGTFVKVAQAVIGRVNAATGVSDRTLFVAAPQIKRGHSHNAALLQKQINTSSDRRCASAPALLSTPCFCLRSPFLGHSLHGANRRASSSPPLLSSVRLKKTTAELLGLSSHSHNRCSGPLGDWENSSECFGKLEVLKFFFESEVLFVLPHADM